MVGVHFQVKFGEEKLAQVEKSNVNVTAVRTVLSVRRHKAGICLENAPLDNLLNELWRERFLGLVVAGHLLQHFWFPAPNDNITLIDVQIRRHHAPVLKHLGWCFDKVTRHAVE